MMKLFLASISILLTSLLISSCACNLECGYCEYLDADACECFVNLGCQCSDGIQNGNETGIDCGGGCDPCFNCLTNYCFLLAGATSIETRSNIKWISVLSNGSPVDGYWKFTFVSNGTVSETYEGESASGYWKFDNPDAPTNININHTDPPPEWDNPIDITLLHLDADTLKLHDIFTKSDIAFIKE